VRLGDDDPDAERVERKRDCNGDRDVCDRHESM
jgi:hypothetical protein